MTNPATTVAEVIARLDEIIRWAIAHESRLGYFAALYNRVTERVRDGIAAGEFADGPRMERLDVCFANRYLDAFDRHRAGDLPSRSWLLAFQSAQRTDLPPLVHLLLGMNAHINLDLGVAAARTCPGPSIEGLRGDFDRINTLLASLVGTVEAENEQMDPDLDKPVAAAGGLGQRAVVGLMDLARSRAWSFAHELAPLDAVAQVPRMAARDTEALAIGEGLTAARPLLRWIQRGEVGAVSDRIAMFAKGEQYRLAT
jgi:hypothetical protein